MIDSDIVDSSPELILSYRGLTLTGVRDLAGEITEQLVDHDNPIAFWINLAS